MTRALAIIFLLLLSPVCARAADVVVYGATPGGMGTILAQNEWLPILRYLGVRHWTEGRMLVSKANTVFDDQGRLTDDKTRGQLAEFVNGFLEFIGK